MGKQKQEIKITKKDIKDGFINIKDESYQFDLIHNGLEYEMTLYSYAVYIDGKLRFVDRHIKDYSFTFGGKKCRSRVIFKLNNL